MERKKLLWISLTTPYSKVSHAGGQTFCHMYSELEKTQNYDITLISIATAEEREAIKEK